MFGKNRVVRSRERAVPGSGSSKAAGDHGEPYCAVCRYGGRARRLRLDRCFVRGLNASLGCVLNAI
jgi:hypothetical protein